MHHSYIPRCGFNREESAEDFSNLFRYDFYIYVNVQRKDIFKCKKCTFWECLEWWYRPDVILRFVFLLGVFPYEWKKDNRTEMNKVNLLKGHIYLYYLLWFHKIIYFPTASGMTYVWPLKTKFQYFLKAEEIGVWMQTLLLDNEYQLISVLLLF